MAEYLIQSETLTSIADKIRVLSGAEGAMTPAQMDGNLGEVNTEVVDQAELIAQIASALEGKAGGNNSQLKTCHISIDCSGLSSVSVSSSYQSCLCYTQVNDTGEIEHKNIREVEGQVYDIPKALCNSQIYFLYSDYSYSDSPIISNNNVIKMIIGHGNVIQGEFMVFYITDAESSSITTLKLRED